MAKLLSDSNVKALRLYVQLLLRLYGNLLLSAMFVFIALCLLAGVLVLAFAKTQIFEVYFFRVYFGLVLLGASHALVLLPVLLSLFGPPQRQSTVQPE